MTTRQRRIVATAVLWLITSAPYIAGYLHATNGAEYLARIPSNPSDTSAYYSNIEQARQGRLLFANQLTSEPQRPSLLQPLWLVTGWLAWLTHLSTPPMFHVVRLLAIALFVICADWLLGYFFSTARDRLVALAVMTTSSGLGWLVASHQFLGRSILGAPIDLWVDESNTFRSLSHSALFIGSQLLLALALWALWALTAKKPIRVARWVGPMLLMLGILHPYDLVTAGVVTVVWIAIWAATSTPDRATFFAIGRRIIIWWAWVIPAGVYYFALPWQQLAVRGWFVQNITLSPTPGALLIGFGVLLPLAVIGAWRGWRKDGRPQAFLVCWAVTVFIITYTPGLSIQRRLLGGVHIPIAILAAAGLIWFIDTVIVRRWKPVVFFLAIVFLASTNLKLMQTDVHDTLHPEQAGYPIFLSPDQAQAIHWLQQHSNLNDVVAADFWNGNTIAGLAARPVIFAHPNQTVASWLREKDWQVLILSATSDQRRREIIQRLHITWLYWAPEDTSGGYQPQHDPLWQPALTSGTIVIYRLQSN